MPEIISFASTLSGEKRSFKFEGAELGVSFFVINYLTPGTGPGLHSHPYAEIFVTLEGEALFTLGEETFPVKAGEIVVAQPNVPHKFVSVGETPLRQVDIHTSSEMLQTELEE